MTMHIAATLRPVVLHLLGEICEINGVSQLSSFRDFQSTCGTWLLTGIFLGVTGSGSACSPTLLKASGALQEVQNDC